ncbi:MAG TPA: pitrilysin family protein [Pyrinomonadaceae bacterium]|nr:pitrilysin family protein [Pyrinomonadaceae bacterium]
MKSPRSQKRRPRGLPLCVLSALILFCAGWFAAAAGQTAQEPRRDQLLNGLRILMLPRPGDENVLIKLRIHDGAAFDLANKEGLMATLADAMFDQQTRNYVSEELGGRLDVATDYDSINITLAGKATDFERLLELARNAVMNTQLTPEAVERVRAERVKTLRERKQTGAERADIAVAARLFGAYPYGRTIGGTPESVLRIERADLLLMRERFLNPDNTTLVIEGGFDPKTVTRTLRESFGGWVKSGRTIPATFRQPEQPDERTLVINEPGQTGVELRIAVRGLARTDRDAPAALVLASVARARWLAAVPELEGRAVFVRHDAFSAGGIFRMGASLRTPAEASKALEAARTVLRDLTTNAPTAAELDGAKRDVAASLNRGLLDVEGAATALLDEHTYNSGAATAGGMVRAANELTPAEAGRVAARLFMHTPTATVAVGDAAQLRTELARAGAVEVSGEEAATPATPKQQPKPQQPALQLKHP